VVPGDAFEVVVPVVGDVVVIVIGGGRAGSAFVGGKRVVVSPWGRWRRRVRSSCRRWVAGSSILLPEHFQRFPLVTGCVRGINTLFKRWNEEEEVGRRCVVDSVVDVGGVILVVGGGCE